ncbi:SAM-dependent methyltransferase [Saccharicrinis sp. FJH2]|uniref:SAM-dependent methyltransferase n=1 Tax=Saccharicrinis sp. FJH65 TaxID=3344659 RepID=UPI0035F2ABE2
MNYIIGIGPGNDIGYLTIKAYRAIQRVDIGIYVGEMIGEEICDLFKEKELITGKYIDKTTFRSILEKAIRDNKEVAILLPGDISMFSGQFNEQFTVDEYIELFEELNYDFEIVAGISAMNALCAKAKIDLTSFAKNQNVLVTSFERLMDSEQFSPDKLKRVLMTTPTLVLYQSYREWHLILKLLKEYYKPNCRVIFAYKISWKDESIICTTLDNVENEITGKKLNKHTIIFIISD